MSILLCHLYRHRQTGNTPRTLVADMSNGYCSFVIPTPLPAARRRSTRLRVTTVPRPHVRFLVAALSALIACQGADDAGNSALAELPPTPAEHSRGESLYDANCAPCHGPKGSGTTQGPPLVHIIYEPGHHGDASFQVAVQRGVFAHHWRFGNMPPQPQVAAEDVPPIIGYVRWLQRQAGIE